VVGLLYIVVGTYEARKGRSIGIPLIYLCSWVDQPSIMINYMISCRSRSI